MNVSGQPDPYLSGRACMEKGHYDSALIYFDRALEMNPGDTETLFQLGKCYFQVKNYPKADHYFYEVERRRKGMASYYLAKTESKLNHPEQAIKYLRIHLSSRYRLPEKEILLDQDFSNLQSEPAWKNLWEEKDWYSYGDKQFREAMYNKSTGDYLEAINILNQLEKQGYERSRVHAEKAKIYEQLGNERAARSEVRSAVKSDVRNLEALKKQAVYSLQEEDYEEAVTYLDRLIRQDPAVFDAYLLRAEGLSGTGDLSGALADLKTYLTYFPGADSAYYLRGKLQFDHGRYLDAIQSFNRALEMNRGNAAYYVARGRTYAATGTIRFAQKDLSMALDLDPWDGEIWFEKGKMDSRMGDREAACFCFQKAFEYGVFEAGEYAEKNCNSSHGGEQ